MNGAWIKKGTSAGFTFECSDCGRKVLYKGTERAGEANNICKYPSCPWCSEPKTKTVREVVTYETIEEEEE